MAISKEIAAIQKRNLKVEGDKAWESSFLRRGSITVVTYLIAVLFLQLINSPRSWLFALVPTGGYVLSTLTLPWIKKWWLINIYKK